MTTYKSILVHYDASRTAQLRLETAIGVAAPYKAHIACLYALSTELDPSYAYEATQIMRDAQQKARAQMLAEAKKGYAECLRRTGFDNIEWRESTADAV